MITIAKYKFNSSIDTLPVFNDDYVYTFSDIDNGDNTTIRTIESDYLPSKISFNNCKGLLELFVLSTEGLMSDMTEAFSGCINLIKIHDSNTWNVHNVTNMHRMFNECNSLIEIDISNWHFNSDLENMTYIFNNCTSLKKVIMNNWTFTSNKNIYMNDIFNNCSSLQEVDMRNWSLNTDSHIDFVSFFNNCNELEILDLEGFKFGNNASNIQLESNGNNMFSNCESINCINMMNTDANTVNSIINVLPIKLEDEPGVMIAAVSDQINLDLAASKYWELIDRMSLQNFASGDVVVRYKFNSAIDTLPVFNSGFNYTYSDIDNNDGTITRTIESSAAPTSISFKGATGLLEIYEINTASLTTMYEMFYDCTALTSIHETDWTTNNVTDMRFTFYNCQSLTSLDLSKWDTSKVWGTYAAFAECHNLTTIGNISKFVNSTITYIYSMFLNCKKLISLNTSDWDVSQVVQMQSLFFGCTSLETLDLSSWKTTNTTNMDWMFFDCKKITALDLKNFNTSKVTSLGGMFLRCESLISLDLSSFNTAAVTDMGGMFNDCKSLTSLNLSSFNTSKVTTMRSLFQNCQSLASIDLSSFNTSAVTDVCGMFGSMYALESLDISNFDLSASNSDMMLHFLNNPISLKTLNLGDIVICEDVTSFECIFAEDDAYQYKNMPALEVLTCSNDSVLTRIANYLPDRTQTTPGVLHSLSSDTIIDSLALPAKNWNVHDYVIAKYTYTGTTSILPTFNSGYTDYVYSSVTNSDSSTTRTIKSFSLPTTLNFTSKTTVTKVDRVKTDALTTMYRMFYGCTALTEVNESNWNTSNVTNMQQVFYNCSALIKTKPLKFDTSKVTTMQAMFRGCSKLTSLDLSSFDTSKVTTFNNIWYGCSALKCLNLSNWNMTSSATYTDLFTSCSNLKAILMENANLTAVQNIITRLLILSSSSRGALNTYGVTGVTSSNITTANNKYWNVYQTEPKNIIQYKFNYSIDTPLPIFNDGYVGYATADSIEDTEDMPAPTAYTMSVLTDYEENGMYETMVINEPEVTDVDEIISADNIITRTIKIISETMPTTMKLGYRPTTFDEFVAYGTVNSADSLLEVTSLDCSSLINTVDMFRACHNLLNIKNVTLTNTTTMMTAMFEECYVLTSVDAADWDTSNVTTMGFLFGKCYALETLDTSNWNTGKVTSLEQAFYGCKMLKTVNVSNWDVSKVENMKHTFFDCYIINPLDVSKWDTSSATSMQNMFSYCLELKALDVSNWNVDKVTSMYQMFTHCHALGGTLDLGKWNPISVTNIGQMFTGLYAIKTIDLTGWSVLSSSITSFDTLFQKCYNVEEIIGLNDLNFTPITNLSYMFSYCNWLKHFDMSKWDISNVTNISYMFQENYGIHTLNINNVNMNKVTNVTGCFDGARNLQLIFSNNSLSNVSKLADYLFNREGRTKGRIFYTGSDTISSDLTTLLNSKHWLIGNPITIAQYKFDKSIYENFVPTYNSELEGCYITNIVEDESNAPDIVTGTIQDLILPTEMMFGSEEADSTEREESLLEISTLLINNITNMSYMFSNCSNLASINASGWNTNNIIDTKYMFYGCSNLTILDCDNWNTSKVTDMAYMFYGCENLISLNCSNWSTGAVTDMSYMFYDCNNLATLNCSNFNTNNVTTIEGIFYNCEQLKELDLSGWKLDKCTDMVDIFYNCSDLETLTLSDNFLTAGSVTNMKRVFYLCSNLNEINIKNWNVSNVIVMEDCLYGCNSLTSLDLTGWNIDNLTSYTNIVECDNLNTITMKNSSVASVNKIIDMLPDRSSDEVSGALYMNVEDESQISYFNANSKNWNVSMKIIVYKFDNSTYDLYPNFDAYFLAEGYDSVDDINGTSTVRTIRSIKKPEQLTFNFEDDRALSLLEINHIVVDDITDMSYMFNNCASLTVLDVSKWDVSDVTNMSFMFNNCELLTNLDVSEWNVGSVTDMNNMFHNCKVLSVIDVSKWDVSNVTSIVDMFNNCNTVEVLDVSNWVTSNIDSMWFAFNDCHSLLTLDMSKWNVSKVKDLWSVFGQCKSLEIISLANWDISNVTAMENTFNNCHSLTILDLSGWNTSNVTNMSYMFNECNSLTTIKGLSNWNTSNVTNMKYMLNNCKLLTSLDLSGFNMSKVENMDNMFYGCLELTTLDLSNWNLSDSVNSTDLFTNCSKLNRVDMYHATFTSINKIAAEIPTTSEENDAKVYISTMKDYSQLNVDSLPGKFWNMYTNGYDITSIYFGNQKINNLGKDIKSIKIGAKKII